MWRYRTGVFARKEGLKNGRVRYSTAKGKFGSRSVALAILDDFEVW